MVNNPEKPMLLAELATEVRSGPGRRAPLRVLVADGHDAMRSQVVELLRRALGAVEVHAAASARDAMMLARAWTFAVFIVDLRLPDSDGFTLATRLRDLHAHAGLLFTSVSDTHVYRELAGRFENSEFIGKHEIGSRLLPAVVEAIGQARASATRGKSG